jgi:hypothetical protein
MRSIPDSRKRRGRPSTGIGRSIGLRLYPDQESKIEAWIKKQSDPTPSLPEAIRRLIDHGLSASEPKKIPVITATGDAQAQKRGRK